MCYMFRPTAAIIRYTELLQSPYLLLYQCSHIGSALYRYVVYVIPLRYKLY
jgi:hypothetical protein